MFLNALFRILTSLLRSLAATILLVLPLHQPNIKYKQISHSDSCILSCFWFLSFRYLCIAIKTIIIIYLLYDLWILEQTMSQSVPQGRPDEQTCVWNKYHFGDDCSDYRSYLRGFIELSRYNVGPRWIYERRRSLGTVPCILKCEKNVFARAVRGDPRAICRSARSSSFDSQKSVTIPAKLRVALRFPRVITRVLHAQSPRWLIGWIIGGLSFILQLVNNNVPSAIVNIAAPAWRTLANVEAHFK